MSLGPWRDGQSDAPEGVSGPYITRAAGEWFDYWRARNGLWWSRGYWTKRGCLQAMADYEAEGVRMPRSDRVVLRWREERPT